MRAWRCSRAWSLSCDRSECRATGRSSLSAPRTSDSALVISVAWAREISPAKSACLVSGQSSSRWAVSNASRAWVPVVPDWRASHAAPSLKPRSLWTPALAARAIVNRRAEAQAFSVAASSSARWAQSAPGNSSGSNPTNAARNAAAAANTEPDTSPPPTTQTR